MDPVGIYDLTMSSETMVSEGTMEVYGEPGGYVGRVSVGGVNARIVLVEPGEGHMSVHVEVEGGLLLFRLAGDGAFLSGNWVMGERRGTVAAKRRRDDGRRGPTRMSRRSNAPGTYSADRLGGPVSTGRSLRPPHSDQDPS